MPNNNIDIEKINDEIKKLKLEILDKEDELDNLLEQISNMDEK